MSGQHRSEGWARYVLAPGDRLRQWWDQQNRPAKWAVGIVVFTVVALLPLYTPPFLNTPGISFGEIASQLRRGPLRTRVDGPSGNAAKDLDGGSGQLISDNNVHVSPYQYNVAFFANTGEVAVDWMNAAML